MTLVKPFRSAEEAQIRHELGSWRLRDFTFYGYAEKEPGEATVWVVNAEENLKWLVAHAKVAACAIVGWHFEQLWNETHTEYWQDEVITHLTELIRAEHWAAAMKAAFTAEIATHRSEYALV
jgi:hypothetical protein